MRTHGGGLLQVFSLFVPEPLKEPRVPEVIRAAVEAQLKGSGISNVRWYAAADLAAGLFAAVDYRSADPEGRFLNLSLWQEWEEAGPQPSPTAAVTLPVRFDHPFGCSQSGRALDAAGEASGRLMAGGWAWDHRVVAVAGTTAGGEEVRTEPVNGCWLLVASGEAGAAGWREFRALDERGKVMYGRGLQS